jgi:hypothetical protein
LTYRACMAKLSDSLAMQARYVKNGRPVIKKSGKNGPTVINRYKPL